MSFNQLSAEEAERLAILLEELGEAQQAIGKVLRHGYDVGSPFETVDNRYNLERELGHVVHAYHRMCRADDFSYIAIKGHEQDKATSIAEYLHEQPLE